MDVAYFGYDRGHTGELTGALRRGKVVQCALHLGRGLDRLGLGHVLYRA